MMLNFPKYPKTPYVFLSDIPVSFRESEDISTSVPLNKQHFVYEKLDGANAAMLLDNSGEVHIRNRTHTLKKGYSKANKTTASAQFIPFWNEAHVWAKKTLPRLNAEFSQPVAVYGEWMLVQHGIVYTNLPSKFIPFALYLVDEGKWITGADAEQVLGGVGSQANLPYIGLSYSSEDVTQYLSGMSLYGDEAKEGVVLWSPVNKQYYKVVAPDYIANSKFDNDHMVYQPQWGKAK